MLKVEGLEAYYNTIKALDGVSLEVRGGEVVTLLGANGAGKSTLLRSISGLLPAKRGSVSFEGKDVTKMRASQIVRLGICHVPEGKQVFASLSVANNLRLGAYVRGGKQWSKEIDQRLEEVLDLFPRLKERLRQRSGTLSGGEQQMLAIARGLMSMPKILLLDEPSLGLAPIIIKDIFKAIEDLRKRGLTLLLVEQNVRAALEIADRGYVLQNGRIVLEGTTQSFLESDLVRSAYLGKSKAG
ncbi:MAG: ABC transporter ATP-binding protein [Dehalococcoidales bacterium]|nr:ABC transporter ATP-binding protein [Dehalococcoidales bacterium]